MKEMIINLTSLKRLLNERRGSILNEIDHKLACYGEVYFMNKNFESHKELLANITEMELTINKVLRTQVRRAVALYKTIETEELKEHHLHLAYLATTLENLDKQVLKITKTISNRLLKEYAFIETSHLETFIEYFHEFKKEFHEESAVRRNMLTPSFEKHKLELQKIKEKMQILERKNKKDSSCKKYLEEIEIISTGYKIIEQFAEFFAPISKDIKFIHTIEKKINKK